MKKAHIAPDYKMVQQIVSKANIDTLFSLTDRRQIRATQVEKLCSLLMRNGHFEDIFVTNRISDKECRLLDGNHRYEAMKKAITLDQTMTIVIWIAEYKNLTPIQEKEVFEKWNIGTKMTADDFVKVWFDEIQYGEEMINKIPASIYGTRTRPKLKSIVGHYIVTRDGRSYLDVRMGFGRLVT